MAIRVTQNALETLGVNPASIRVTQSALEMLCSVATVVSQSATFANTNTFPADGVVAVGRLATQSATFENHSTFYGGTVSRVEFLTVYQNNLFQNTSNFPSGGIITPPDPPPAIPPDTGPASPGTALLGERGVVSRITLAAPGPNSYDAQLSAFGARAAALLGVPLSGPPSAGLRGLGGEVLDTNGLPSRPILDGLSGRQEQSRQFFRRGSIVTPVTGAIGDLVLEWVVPTGYTALIYAYYTLYTGTGFVQGSGDLVWRVRIGRAWARNMGNLLFAVGSLRNPYPVQDKIRAESGARIQVTIDVPNLSGTIQTGASRILAGLQGWLIPERERE